MGTTTESHPRRGGMAVALPILSFQGTFATDEEGTQNDKLKQEIEHLKKVNALWKTLNNDMLSSTLKNFEM
jgi:hypothetical protein